MLLKSRAHFGILLKARGLLKLPAAEVGVCDGTFARDILAWGVAHLYLIDAWKHVDGAKAEMGDWSQEMHEAARSHCMTLMRQHHGRFTELRGWSHEMAKHIPDGSLGFCNIDASHEHADVLRDLDVYWPKMAPGGILAGHDWPIVKLAVQQFATSRNVAINEIPENGADASYWMEKL